MYYSSHLYVANKTKITIIEIPDTLKYEEVLKVNISELKQAIIDPGLTIHAIYLHNEGPFAEEALEVNVCLETLDN
jgi:hypothetical protein